MTDAEQYAVDLSHGRVTGGRQPTMKFKGVSKVRGVTRDRPFHVSVPLIEANGRGRAIHIGTFPCPTFAATTYDVAAMILGREPANFSRSAYQAMSQARLARLWAITLDILTGNVTPRLAVELASRPNPFRGGPDHG